jgi:hypothetical protein
MVTHNQERTDLHEALKVFAASPRFNFLKSIQVGPLVGDDAKTLGSIASMTFEELVASVDNHSSDLHQLSAGQERLLTAVLRALAEGEVADQPEPGFDTSDESQESDDESTQTTFNSVQCELELRERITQLKAHPGLARIKDLTVGSFWAPDLARAPFEESFTVSQLLALDLGVLAKKRSMTSARMRALATALERGLHSLDGEPAVDSRKQPPVEHKNHTEEYSEPVKVDTTHFVEVASEKPFRHKWMGHFETCSPSEMALVESVMYASSDDERNADTVFGALHHFCLAFSVADFLAIMNGATLSVSTNRKLVAWAHSSSLREIVPLVRMSLQGPGVHVSRIAHIIGGSNPAAAVYGITATLIIRGLGAQQVAVGGNGCPNVWTCNPALVSLIVSKATSDRKVSVSASLTSTCPEMDPFLHAWLQGIVSPPKKGKKSQRRR